MTQRLPRKSILHSSSMALGLLLAILLVAAVGFSRYALNGATDSSLANETLAAINAETRGLLGSTNSASSVADRLSTQIDGRSSDFLYALRQRSGDMVIGNFGNWDSQIVDGPTGKVFTADVLIRDGNGRIRSTDSQRLMLLKSELDSGEWLLVGRNVDDLFYAQPYAQTFAWLLSGILLFCAAASIWVGYYVFDRMNRVAATALNIVNTGDLSRRLPVDSTWDDLSKMSIVLNRFLEELEAMVAGVRSVSDSITHDLRTPLTRLRAQLEDLPDSEEKWSLIEEVDSTLQLFAGLLRISEIENEKRLSEFRRLSLSDLLRDVAEFYQPVAEEEGLSLVLEIHASQVSGDSNMLFQLFSNLLENAIKFTPSGGRIELGCKAESETILAWVADSGPGIPLERREEVFQRFRRLDDSRATAGHGLGLALVAAVARLHQAQIEMSDSGNDTGLRCSLRFPRAEGSFSQQQRGLR